MKLFGRKSVEPDPDLLVILDGNTWQSRNVIHQDEAQVSDGERSFPKKAISRFWHEDTGRVIWLVNGPPEVLIQAEQLEEVRFSNVLRNVFAYQKPLPNPNYVIYVGLLLALIIAIWRG